MLRLVVLLFVVTLSRGKPVNQYTKKDLLEMVQRAIKEGVEKSFETAQSIVASEFDAWQDMIKKDEYKTSRIPTGNHTFSFSF